MRLPSFRLFRRAERLSLSSWARFDRRSPWYRRIEWLRLATAIFLASAAVSVVLNWSLTGPFYVDLLRWMVAGCVLAAALPRSSTPEQDEVFLLWSSSFLLFAALPILSASRYDELVIIFGVSVLGVPLAWRLWRGGWFVPRPTTALVPTVLSVVALPIVRWRDPLAGDRLAFAIWLSLLLIVVSEVVVRVRDRASHQSDDAPLPTPGPR